MGTFDLFPFYPASVNFDNAGRIMAALTRMDEDTPSNPPYDIEKVREDVYRITLVVPGFTQGDLDVVSRKNVLTITGTVRDGQETTEYLHRGIIARPFERRFELADHICVNGATLANGLLHIELIREIPEAMKPRSIPVTAGGDLPPVAAGETTRDAA